MNCDNRFFNGFILVVVGILGATSLIVCMSLSVRAGLSPMGGAMREVLALQKSLDAKITDGAIAQTAALDARVTALEKELNMFKQRLAAGPGDAAEPAPQGEDMNKVYELPVGDSAIIGKADAKVTFVEFSDFECPFCARFHPILMEVAKAFPNDVKIVLKNYPLPFHQQARPAAKAALAAGLQGKYYEMAGAIMDNAKSLSDEKYKELAGKLGLNVEQFTKDLKEKDAMFEARIQADVDLAQKSDVRGTPTYFINGKKSPSRDVQGWKAEVQALLQK